MPTRSSAAVALLVLLTLAGCNNDLTAEQVVELSQAVDTNYEAAQAMDAAWRAGVLAHLGQPRIANSCPDGVLMPGIGSFEAENYTMVDLANLEETFGTRQIDIDDQVETLRCRLSKSGPDPTGSCAASPLDKDGFVWAQEWAEQLSSSAEWPYELTYLVTERVNPSAQGAVFAPGRLAGRAMVWSYAEAAVVCDAAVTVTSETTEQVLVTDVLTNNEMLLTNLETRAYNAVLEALGL